MTFMATGTNWAYPSYTYVTETTKEEPVEREDNGQTLYDWIDGLQELIKDAGLNDLQKVKLLCLNIALLMRSRNEEEMTASEVVRSARTFERYITSWEQDALDATSLLAGKKKN